MLPDSPGPPEAPLIPLASLSCSPPFSDSAVAAFHLPLDVVLLPSPHPAMPPLLPSLRVACFHSPCDPSAGVPNHPDLTPDDLGWSWCNNNRNKVHDKCNALESSWNHAPSTPVRGKIVFHETGPLCQEGWRQLHLEGPCVHVLWRAEGWGLMAFLEFCVLVTTLMPWAPKLCCSLFWLKIHLH